jgi:outer membrane murein-binding lipoprotein Lpp
MNIPSILTALALFASVHFVHAQAPAAPGASNSNRGRGNFEEFRKKMAERLKESLKVSDEEWAVIQPLIEKVTTKQREAMGGRGFGGASRGGDRGGNPPATGGSSTDPARAGSAERDALRSAVEDENTSAAELKAKLTAVREQRKKATAELAEAREELRKVLTVRQEAALVSYGILE